ncbi:hypothetical protein CAEBREN_06028 [Caenorhabditis brenneri]|uniref:Uncharacterized protein n=1 Tax=Caenorhabditis brenneri TaxID=135651 RepID=G0NLW5_CAEBE|nr:hypothetical protein CAEBREN_06028 [Caenorhabditis brenneri]
MKRQSTIELASIHESQESIEGLREILAHTENTPFASQASTPTRAFPTRFERMASQMTCPIIAEENSFSPEPDRPLSRCLSEIRPAPLPNPHHHPTRRFSSIFRRPSRHTVDRRASGDFTSAWLRTSNFDLRDSGGEQGEPGEHQQEEGQDTETMGIPTQTDTIGHVRFPSERIERPVHLTRIDSNYSIRSSEEESDENGSTNEEIDKTPDSAETTWMRDKTAK